jgi:hypothetical protein
MVLPSVKMMSSQAATPEAGQQQEEELSHEIW